MDYSPNIHGLLWFYEAVWPGLKSTIDGIQLTIIGRNGNDPRYTSLKEDTRINFVGEVEDVTPYYEEHNIAIVPLLEGSGTRLKILEAMAFGNPVISTAIGAAGLRYQDRKNILIANRPEDFHSLFTEIFIHRSIPLADISQGALELVSEEYTWESIGENLFKVMEELHNSYFAT